MSPKLRRFVAIVALVFMGIFMVSAMMYFIDKTLLNNSVEFLMIFSGALAISLYLVILFDNKFGTTIQNFCNHNQNGNHHGISEICIGNLHSHCHPYRNYYV